MFLPKLDFERARLYESVRSAHLERARQLHPASIVYREKRYDFDERLTEGLNLVHANRLKAALLLARSRLRQLEINEPLMLSSLPATALALAAIRLADALSGRRTQIVAYAIGNMNPFAGPRSRRWKQRIRKKFEHRLALYVWRRLDRVAFGTPAALEVYSSVLLCEPKGPEERLIPALPAPCGCHPTDPTVAGRVAFLARIFHDGRVGGQG